jgi:hypothetical protein
VISAPASRARSVISSTSSREATLWASAIPLQLAPSSTIPMSLASFDRAQRTCEAGFLERRLGDLQVLLAKPAYRQQAVRPAGSRAALA